MKDNFDNNVGDNGGKNGKMIKIVGTVVLLAIIVAAVIIMVLGGAGDDGSIDGVEGSTEEENNGDAGETTEEVDGEKGEDESSEEDSDDGLATSDYVVNCSLFSADKIDNYPTYGSAAEDIKSSIATMSRYDVPSGLEDFNALTIDAWNTVLGFAEAQAEDAEFDSRAADVQTAMQFFSAASEQITSEQRNALTDAGCIGVV